MSDVISIDALTEDNHWSNFTSEAQMLLASADVIVGVDWTSRREVVVFGRQTLEQTAGTSAAGQLKVLKVGVDERICELEKLKAWVTVVRGSPNSDSPEGRS